MRRRVTWSLPGSKLFDTQTTFSPTLSDIEALLNLKQTRILADDNLVGGLRVNTYANRKDPDQAAQSRSTLLAPY